MPRVSFSVPHSLAHPDALERMKQKALAVVQQYAGQVRDLKQQWNESVLSFSFAAMGMGIKGAVAVEPSTVTFTADVPLLAMAFRGTLERQVRDEVNRLLA